MTGAIGITVSRPLSELIVATFSSVGRANVVVLQSARGPNSIEPVTVLTILFCFN